MTNDEIRAKLDEILPKQKAAWIAFQEKDAAVRDYRIDWACYKEQSDFLQKLLVMQEHESKAQGLTSK